MRDNRPLLIPELRFAIFTLSLIAATHGGLRAETGWPHWRGPTGNGVSPDGKPPVTWSETQNVTATNGIYQVMLGSATTMPSDLFDGDTRYLGVTIGADSECSPRQQITSVAYSVKSGKADDADKVDGLHASSTEAGSER